MPGVQMIELFDVPPSDDDAFLATWRRERGDRRASLFRALRADRPIRFIGVTALDERSRAAGTYEVVHDDGAVDEPGGVILIEPFQVPPADHEAFLVAWHRRRDVLAGQRGQLGTRLHRSIGPADFEFVAIARWSSPLMVQRAQARPEVARATVPFRSHPAFYQRV